MYIHTSVLDDFFLELVTDLTGQLPEVSPNVFVPVGYKNYITMLPSNLKYTNSCSNHEGCRMEDPIIYF